MKLRRIIVIGVIVIIVLWLGITCVSKLGSGTGSVNTPEGAVKSVIMSFEGRDSAKVASYFTPIPGALMAHRTDSMFTNFDTIDIQNLRVMLILKEGSSARVEATYDMVVTVNGAVDTQHVVRTIKLVESVSEKRWYINEAF